MAKVIYTGPLNPALYARAKKEAEKAERINGYVPQVIETQTHTCIYKKIGGKVKAILVDKIAPIDNFCSSFSTDTAMPVSSDYMNHHYFDIYADYVENLPYFDYELFALLSVGISRTFCTLRNKKYNFHTSFGGASEAFFHVEDGGKASFSYKSSENTGNAYAGSKSEDFDGVDFNVMTVPNESTFGAINNFWCSFGNIRNNYLTIINLYELTPDGLALAYKDATNRCIIYIGDTIFFDDVSIAVYDNTNGTIILDDAYFFLFFASADTNCFGVVVKINHALYGEFYNYFAAIEYAEIHNPSFTGGVLLLNSAHRNGIHVAGGRGIILTQKKIRNHYFSYGSVLIDGQVFYLRNFQHLIPFFHITVFKNNEINSENKIKVITVSESGQHFPISIGHIDNETGDIVRRPILGVFGSRGRYYCQIADMKTCWLDIGPRQGGDVGALGVFYNASDGNETPSNDRPFATYDEAIDAAGDWGEVVEVLMGGFVVRPKSQLRLPNKFIHAPVTNQSNPAIRISPSKSMCVDITPIFDADFSNLSNDERFMVVGDEVIFLDKGAFNYVAVKQDKATGNLFLDKHAGNSYAAKINKLNGYFD